MARKEVHYEVFRRLGAKGGWTLHDVSTGREKALQMAAELMTSEKATGVKVVKETYDADTGDYLTLKIFEDGHTQMKVDAAAEDVPHALPCFKPDDLYTYHARATLNRLLRDYLARNKITVSELIHRADCLEMLEANGTTYQHAVQKIAVAQAASTTVSVQQIIKSVNELATKAIHRVYRDTQRGYFPAVKPGSFGALAAKLAEESDGNYIFNGTLARHLAPLNSWNEKLVALLAIMHEAPEEGAGRKLLLGAIDNLIAEILGGSAALHELIGQSDNLGHALATLSDLFVGGISRTDDSEGIAGLAEQFSCDGLPGARTAIANRIIAELKSTRRLCPQSLVEEVTQLRKVANRLVLGDQRYMSHEDLIAAFTLRSRRLVAHETLNDYLAEATTPDAKIERLLHMEENIVGAENKRQLAAAMQQLLASPGVEAHFVVSSQPVMARLRRLAELQARMRRSNFTDAHRDEFSDWLDRVASEAEQRGKVFKALIENLGNPVERALAILKLCSSNVLTEGRLSGKAREIALSTLGQPGFLAGYIARTRDAAGSNPERALADLVQLLQGAGISRETGLKSIAA